MLSSPAVASSRLFAPHKGELQALGSGATPDLFRSVMGIHQNIQTAFKKPDYPCPAALRSLKSEDFQLGVYGRLGEGKFARELACDLKVYLENQIASGSEYLSLLAVFEEGPFEASEQEFEDALWRELSYVSGFEDPGYAWDPNFSSDPKDDKFCFSLWGHAFFVVGMHPWSSRKARRFSCPTLVFNVYRQFKSLMDRGQFEGMVKSSRQRDLRFQGSVNPMVEAYSETRESIQFSGRENSPEWKCPFSRGKLPA